MKLDYFYGAQMERVMKHLIRIFNNFKVKEGYDEQGNELSGSFPVDTVTFREWLQPI